MDKRLSLTTLAVPDLAEARRFFHDAFGWTADATPSEEIAFYQLPGMVFALYSRTALEAELGRALPTDTLGGITIAWNGTSEAEVDQTFNAAIAAGAKAIKNPVKAFWGGYSAYIEIPGGHLMEIGFNPFWSIEEDGSTRMPPAPE